MRDQRAWTPPVRPRGAAYPYECSVEMSQQHESTPDPRTTAPVWNGPPATDTPPELCSYWLEDYTDDVGVVLFDSENPLAWIEYDGLYIAPPEHWA